MAVTADVKSFWGALLSVLLKCIAALGFTTPARTANAAVAGAEVLPAGTVRVGGVLSQRRTEADGAGGAKIRTRARRATVPTPRAYEPQQRRLDLGRKRTLPPTMKQRIGAEAHGSSPSARSLRIDDLLGADFAGAMNVLGSDAPAPASAASGVSASATAAPTAATAAPADTSGRAAGSGATPVACLTR